MNESLRRRDFFIAGIAGTTVAALTALPQDLARSAPHGPGTKVRYGVVGTGLRSVGHHLPILKTFVPQVEVIALCDIRPEALERGREIFPHAVPYTDHRRMLSEQEGLDAVLVVVPSYLHADIAVHALEAGKHVLVEKPMAIRLVDADRMIDVARKKGLVLQVGLQNRFGEAYRQMARRIREGAIGDVKYIYATKLRDDWNPQSWKYTDPISGIKTNWRFLTKTAGSALLEDGIHQLDIIHMLAGSQPARIQAQGGNAVFKDRETIDNAGLLVEFANGLHLTFAYTIFTPTTFNPAEMRILGSKGEMRLERSKQPGSTDVVIAPYAGASERDAVPDFRPEEESWKKAPEFDVNCARQHNAFVKSIVASAPVVVDGQSGRDAIHISLAAERSLRMGGRVVRWDEESGI